MSVFFYYYYYRCNAGGSTPWVKVKMSNNNMMTTFWPAVLWQQQRVHFFVVHVPPSTTSLTARVCHPSSLIRIPQFLSSTSVNYSREQKDLPPYKGRDAAAFEEPLPTPTDKTATFHPHIALYKKSNNKYDGLCPRCCPFTSSNYSTLFHFQSRLGTKNGRIPRNDTLRPFLLQGLPPLLVAAATTVSSHPSLLPSMYVKWTDDESSTRWATARWRGRRCCRSILLLP